MILKDNKEKTFLEEGYVYAPYFPVDPINTITLDYVTPMTNKITLKNSQVNIKQFLKACKYVTKIKKPILVRGRHGIGKSEIIAQFAESIGYKMVDRRASQMSEGDLCGIPKVKNGVTHFNPLNWFAECCNEPRVLFLDEIDRAPNEVRQGFFELADSRKIFGHTLHPDTLVFCAVNGGNVDNIHYMTHDMGVAEIDRWTVFDLEPTVEEWLNWGTQVKNNKENVIEIIREYIRIHPNTLEFVGEYVPNKVYPSRRSWTRFSQCIQEDEKLLKDRLMLTIIGTGFLGLETALGFADFAETYDIRITPSDIMIANLWEETKTFNSRDHLRLIEEFQSWDRFKKLDFKDSHYQNLWNYIKILGAELFMKFYDILTGVSPGVWNELIRVTNEEIVKMHNSYLSIEEDCDNMSWDINEEFPF